MTVDIKGLKAKEALGEIKDARAESLIKVLKEGDLTTRKMAVIALGEIGDARAVEPLIDILKEKSDIFLASAEALGKIRDTRAVEPLIAMFESGTGSSVRTIAANALGQIGDARAVDPLIAALQDNDWELHSIAANALGQIGDARAVDPLIAALQDNDWDVREIVASALGQIGDARAVEPLIAALQDRNSIVREKAASALGQIGDDRAVEPLIAMLQDNDRQEDERKAIETSLGKLGATIPEMQTPLEEKDSTKFPYGCPHCAEWNRPRNAIPVRIRGAFPITYECQKCKCAWEINGRGNAFNWITPSADWQNTRYSAIIGECPKCKTPLALYNKTTSTRDNSTYSIFCMKCGYTHFSGQDNQ